MEFLIIPPDPAVPATVAVQQSQNSPSTHAMPESVKYRLRFSVILHVSIEHAAKLVHQAPLSSQEYLQDLIQHIHALAVFH